MKTKHKELETKYGRGKRGAGGRGGGRTHSRQTWEGLLVDGLVSNVSLISRVINNTILLFSVTFPYSRLLLTAYHYNPIRTRHRSGVEKNIGYNSSWRSRNNHEDIYKPYTGN